jgi:ATP-dependent DNA ligase
LNLNHLEPRTSGSSAPRFAARSARFLPGDLIRAHPSALNEYFRGDGLVIYKHACALGCEGLGSPYRAGRLPLWLKVKNSEAPAVKREAEEEWQ